jgi:phosphate transport system substrate-binding protein
MRLPPLLLLGLLLALANACRGPAPSPPHADLLYLGSSTVATFVAAADALYPGVTFTIDTGPESDGGERAIIEDACDLAGVARNPGPQVEASGVRATLIGRDAIAVVVHPGVGLQALSRADLARLFRGEVADWSELGGNALPIRPFVVGASSATRAVLRRELLEGNDVVGCEEVRPDAALVERVASTPGGVGAISFAFLGGHPDVVTLAIDGQRPSVTNFEYPLSRPLHLLWRPGNPAVRAFVDWSLSPKGQHVVMRRFVGTDVRGSVSARSAPPALGFLLVNTETNEELDGGVLYYPHRGYDLLTRHGDRIRRVRNHRGLNDEKPTRVALEPGVYLIRTDTRSHGVVEFFATVTAGRTTELDVQARLGDKQR